MKFLQPLILSLLSGFLQNCGETRDCRRCIHITDVSRPQVFHLKNTSGEQYHIRLWITADMDHNAELRMYSPMNMRIDSVDSGVNKKLDNSNFIIVDRPEKIPIPNYVNDLKYVQDWYADTLTLYYDPKKATKGELTIKWQL